MLRSYVKDIKAWDDYIPTVEFAINNNVNLDTGKTPFELDCGQHPLDPISVCLDLQDTDSSLLHDWNTSVLEAVAAYKDAQHKRLDMINERRWDPDFEIGDYVWMCEFSQQVRFCV